MKPNNKQRHIGLLFGSFNPIHRGHVLLGESVITHRLADEVWYIVSPHNPHKDYRELASFDDRYHMVTLALSNKPSLRPSAIEKNLPVPSFTYQTLRELRRLHPGIHFSLIVGSDVMQSLHTWKHPEEIMQNHDFLVRKRTNAQMVIPPGVRATIIPGMYEVSATQVRTLIEQESPVSEVDPRVSEYIAVRNLYR